MFFHNYRYRLKCILRDRQTMFWTLLFPIILATLFNLTLSNIGSSENFTNINLDLVLKASSYENDAFLTAANNTGLFNIELVSKEEAQSRLTDNQIDGYILFNSDPQLFVSHSGLSQTIIKSFLDSYLQASSTLTNIAGNNPNALQSGLTDSLSDRRQYLSTVFPGKNVPDQAVNYFYTVIAMACLYGGFLGLKEITAIQADLSDVGARVSLSPSNKLKVFLSSMLAAATIQLIVVFVLILYLLLILRVNFGNQLGLITLTCLVGSFTGVSFGAFIAAIVKRGEGVKTGILIGSSMTMCFLSGMMYENMKYFISKNIPFLSYLNPANLITDSFYSLYYYNTHSQFFTNIGILCGFIVLFSSMTYLVIRRQKYASL